jgi:hypothetical protein
MAEAAIIFELFMEVTTAFYTVKCYYEDLVGCTAKCS